VAGQPVVPLPHGQYRYAEMDRDYYEILGVSRDATPEEIKAAYRKLAVECHPDRNPGDRESEERFKEAAESYDVLRDAQKRRRYDMYGHEGLRGAGARHFSTYEDIFAAFGEVFGGGFGSIFGDFFGGTTRQGTRRARGASLRCDVEVTFEEAADGVEKTISLRRADRCPACGGTGARPGTSPTRCPGCHGRGEVMQSRGFFAIRSTCPQCRGNGEIIESPCADCKGTGLRRAEREITVRIPPGIEDSTRLRIPGEGEPGERGGPNGDLYCYITLKPHPLFERRGDDIVLEAPLSFTEAVRGIRVDVPTLHGLRTMKVPPGTQSGTILTLRGEGFPNVHGFGQGEQLVRIVVEIPKKPAGEYQKLIKKVAEYEEKHVSPRKLEYTAKLQEYYKKNSKP